MPLLEGTTGDDVSRDRSEFLDLGKELAFVVNYRCESISGFQGKKDSILLQISSGSSIRVQGRDKAIYKWRD